MPKGVSINFSLSKAARRASRIMGEYIDSIARIQVDEIRRGFIPGVDVENKKYEPSIVNRRPIRLFKSGTMQKGVHVSTFTKKTGGTQKATITSGSRSKAYAEVHNEGIGVMPKRQFFPTDKLIKRGDARIEIEKRVLIRQLKDIRK
ncbi:MAG TPA: hypothetical protein ENI07_15980 [Desulfobacterales bacterium]|nr:hypothetical protein [Desulfobacterales bacterium]